MSNDSPAAYEAIEGHQLVLSRFGMWPSFHDGEVHRIVLDRTRVSFGSTSLSTLEVWIRTWTMKMCEGHYVRTNDSVVHFWFEDVSEFELEGFNQQNVLTALNISLDAQALHIEFEHCYKFEGKFRAQKGIVMDVKPFEPASGS